MRDYDVIIMGAGPAGSTLARHLVERGFRVCILEKKKIIGVPLQCAGLVSHRIREVNMLPDEVIINSVRGAFLHSPSGVTLKVSKDRPEAHVIDRTAYDQYLADLAREAGAEIKLKTHVRGFKEKTGTVYVKGQEFSAGVIVDARGSRAARGKYHALQCLVRFNDHEMDTDFVNLKVDSRLSPGFIWRIPLDERTARVGLFGPLRDAGDILRDFLSGISSDFQVLERYHGFIPIHDNKMETLRDRLLVIGDAAGQVKPTTGGGIVLSSRAALAAAEAIQMALEDDIKLLETYRDGCRRIYSEEIKNQLRVQKTFAMLSDDDLDHIFRKMKEYGAEDIISRYGDMDIQTPLIKEFIRRGLLFRIIPSFLLKRVAGIWKY